MYTSPGSEQKGEKLVHPLQDGGVNPQQNDFSMKKILSIFVVVIIVGVISGYGFAFMSNGSSTGKQTTATTETGKKNEASPPQKAGVDDTTTFKDNAEGMLREGGIGGEGDYHLERPGGESQNVYLTSSTVDLSKYLDKKVKVKGQTYSAEKAGWLMDVGLIEISQ